MARVRLIRKELNNKNIIMFLGSTFEPHVRVLQEATSLMKYGYRITIIGWDRTAKQPVKSMYKGIEIYHIRIQSNYGSGIRQFPGLLLYWVSAFLYTLRIKNIDVYHAHDFFTLPLAFSINLIRKRKLIYDSHENFPEFLKKGNPSLVSKIIEIMERFFLKKVDYTITASDALDEKFKSLGIKNVRTIGNWKSKKIINIDKKKVENLRKRFNITKKDFVVVYAGGLTRDRDVVPLINAVEDNEGIKVIIFGKGENQFTIESACNKNNNAFYGGWVPLKDVPSLYHLADVIFYALKQDSPLSKFNAPNSLGYSLIFGKPMIAYGGGDLKKIVQKNRCGVILKDLKIKTIQKGLEEVREKYKYYSQNAKKIGEESYNWENMEKKLLQIYRFLTI